MTHTAATNLAQNKSQLAKLLAAENLTVIINPNARTASFDTAKRILELPMWLNMDADVYDLLVGHEVGHALYTFSDELVAGVTALHAAMYPKDAGNDRSPSMRIVHQVVNVVEDPRIEKLTKRRYPGIRPAFNRGYKRLWTDGFFGQAAANVSALSITDRINLHFKVGTHVKVPFTAVELKLVAMVEAAETMADVFAAARAIIEHVRAEAEKAPQDAVKKPPESEDTDEQMEDGDPSEFAEYNEPENDAEESDEDQRDGRPCNDGEQSSSEDDEDGESEGDEPSDGDDSEESDEDSDEESENSTADMRGAGDETETDDKNLHTEYSEMDALKSLTESALAENQKSLAAGQDINLVAVTSPVFDMPKNVFDYKEVLSQNRASFERNHRLHYFQHQKQEISDYKTQERANISYMLKEFELRRAARTHARTMLTKTGRLDTNKLHSYKTSDDLFRRNAIVNKGQSHGLFFLVDFSGSMAYSIKPLVKSLISLTMFCRLTNVPFEVYFFTDACYPTGKYSGTLRDERATFKTSLPTDAIMSNRVYLRNILSSRMTLSEYTEACVTFKMISEQASDVDTMGGTPLLQSLMMCSELIGKFKKDNGLDCVSFITMTDGMSDGFEGTPSNNLSGYWSGSSKPTYITYTDKVTKRTYSAMTQKNNNSSANSLPSILCGLIIKSIAERHNANTLGYFIADRRNAMTAITDLGVTDYDVRHKLIEQYKSEGFVSIKALGYDEYFVISPATFEIREKESFGKTAPSEEMSVKKVFSEYRKTVGKRERGRSLMKSFVARITAKDAA